MSDAFLQELRRVGASISANRDVDDIMLNLSERICDLFGADRLTIYALGDDQASLISKVKTGLTSFKQLKLPISADSIAGYAALSGKMLNLLDVYDEAELQRYSPALRFQQGVDRRTGYRTREMLVAPIAGVGNCGLMGVVQLINNRHGGPFSRLIEDGVRELSIMLAAAFAERGAAPLRERGRFAALIPEMALPRAQLDKALQLASTAQRDIEDVLIDDTGVRIVLVGRALADFYSVPYFTYNSAHRRPSHVLDKFNREQVLRQQWMPIDEGSNGLFLLAVNPEQARTDNAVAQAFPGLRPIWCVTTRREFSAMVAQFFGAEQTPAAPQSATVASTPQPTVPPDLAAVVSGLALEAHRYGITRLTIETAPGDKPGEVRFQVSGVFVSPA